MKKILVVDDHKATLQLLCHQVQEAGFEAVAVESHSQVKAVLQDASYDEYLCAVVDFSLPDALDGEAIDTCITAGLATIVVTGRMDNATREKVLTKQVVDYIPKENVQVYDYLTRLIKRLETNSRIGVLVVDDTRLNRIMISDLLHRHNFNTYEANDGEEGLTMLRQHRDIKLVITDENMPNMTGVEMVAELRRSFSKEDLAVIGISAQGSSALSARFLKSGANDYISKPYCNEEFFCRVVQNIEHIENMEAIRRSANIDDLTGLNNRKHFFKRLNANLRMAPKQLSLAIIDIDNFRRINDEFGHDVGDETLIIVADMLKAAFKQFYLARFGGEEFSVYLPGVDPKKAHELLDKFRAQVENHEFDIDGHQFSCTVSVGITNQYHGDIQHTIKAADISLCKSKDTGGNHTISD